jgi:alginate O-acetyltransferase complex protein AlgI
MLGLNGLSLPQSLSSKLSFLSNFGITFQGTMPNLYSNVAEILPFIMILLVIVWFTPNTQQWLEQYQPSLDYFVTKKTLNWQTIFWQKLQWQPIAIWSLMVTLMTIVSFWSLSASHNHHFIYFNY